MDILCGETQTETLIRAPTPTPTSATFPRVNHEHPSMNSTTCSRDTSMTYITSLVKLFQEAQVLVRGKATIGVTASWPLTPGLTKNLVSEMSSCNRMRKGVIARNNEASLRYRNSAEITLLVCEQRPSYPVVFVPAQEVFGIVVGM